MPARFRHLAAWPPLGAALAALLLALAPVVRGADEVAEAELKAAYIYNFLRFTEWPQPMASSQAFILCVPAGSRLLLPLRALDGKPVGASTVTVASFTGPEPLAIACRALLRDDSLVRPAAGPGVLSIATGGEGGRNGSIITLSVEGDRLVFDIDSTAAATAGLQFSSQLLRLARTVR